ncbi:SDR family NAD(P)-dependent oxidoreductase [Polymorphobacter fuscus]|uniref:SDR family oxidoreductase n=1 Tax=Sandarakinorhabdus fusca TaxID=1439888 RepID=A0A7C9GQC9_9SPHN|nr:SDR family NAD(P)-dependent oxidoreductase [Polymorphobacter fuscus]KAB7646273.1 SDR family oxidoreductase [Polymorphobacter fuscus]MQT17490.1 SDR family oxidoreductase [Polymorphobacter fuscus]NJC09971.1 3-oxoacyl-[acyl-carrier protein] reductase [Polymorphobacter fuscus]
MSEVFTGRFAGQVAVVTGGAAGIGRATAERLAAEGALVSVWDISETALGECAFAAQTSRVDQSDEAQVVAAAAAVMARFGRLDILVVSAGITGPNATVETYPSDAWQQVMAVNVNGTFFCNKAVIPHMKANGYGRIVNVASVAGKEGNPNASAYSASKAAVIGLTKSLGKELAQTNITVNAVTPAAVKTAIFDQMTQTHIDFMLSKIPIGRFGTVDENAAMICFLASTEASFSTGAVFDTSGGRATY